MCRRRGGGVAAGVLCDRGRGATHAVRGRCRVRAHAGEYCMHRWQLEQPFSAYDVAACCMRSLAEVAVPLGQRAPNPKRSSGAASAVGLLPCGHHMRARWQQPCLQEATRQPSYRCCAGARPADWQSRPTPRYTASQMRRLKHLLSPCQVSAGAMGTGRHSMLCRRHFKIQFLNVKALETKSRASKSRWFIIFCLKKPPIKKIQVLAGSAGPGAREGAAWAADQISSEAGGVEPFAASGACPALLGLVRTGQHLAWLLNILGL